MDVVMSHCHGRQRATAFMEESTPKLQRRNSLLQLTTYNLQLTTYNLQLIAPRYRYIAYISQNSFAYASPAQLLVSCSCLNSLLK